MTISVTFFQAWVTILLTFDLKISALKNLTVPFLLFCMAELYCGFTFANPIKNNAFEEFLPILLHKKLQSLRKNSFVLDIMH